LAAGLHPTQAVNVLPRPNLPGQVADLNISMLEAVAFRCKSQFSQGFLQFVELPFVLLLDINGLTRNAVSMPLLASSIHSDRISNI
jgi:hypothetical protein